MSKPRNQPSNKMKRTKLHKRTGLLHPQMFKSLNLKEPLRGGYVDYVTAKAFSEHKFKINSLRVYTEFKRKLLSISFRWESTRRMVPLAPPRSLRSNQYHSLCYTSGIWGWGGGAVLHWPCSFLSERSQKRILCDCYLTPWSLTYGVPHRSGLSWNCWTCQQET